MNKEYKELLSLFAKYRVRYLIVGAYAVGHYTEPRFTKDIDLWIDNSRIWRAAKRARAGNLHRAIQRVQVGIEPVRIDVISSLPGIRFGAAWNNRDSETVEGVRIHFISKAELIRTKKRAGRRKDFDDIDSLEGKS